MDPNLNANVLGSSGGALSRLQPGKAQPSANSQAFEALLQGAASSVPTATTPSAHLLFNRMGQGVALPPQGLQARSTFEARLSEARQRLYAAELGPRAQEYATLGTVEGFLKFRGLQAVGPVLDFTHAVAFERA